MTVQGEEGPGLSHLVEAQRIALEMARKQLNDAIGVRERLSSELRQSIDAHDVTKKRFRDARLRITELEGDVQAWRYAAEQARDEINEYADAEARLLGEQQPDAPVFTDAQVRNARHQAELMARGLGIPDYNRQDKQPYYDRIHGLLWELRKQKMYDLLLDEPAPF